MSLVYLVQPILQLVGYGGFSTGWKPRKPDDTGSMPLYGASILLFYFMWMVKNKVFSHGERDKTRRNSCQRWKGELNKPKS